jgi:CYTH domain-containing protein
MPGHKYARTERERRFLVKDFPLASAISRTRHITDLYIEATRLRLREQTECGIPTVYKLTQKIPIRGEAAQQGFITNLYLTESEFQILARLPARKLVKTRHSVSPFGIDTFEGEWSGLCLAEAEFESAADADALTIPSFVHAEVTDDDRFTGGRLVNATRGDLQSWLSEYGIHL